MRLLLLKQDQLQVKDSRLREIDEAETFNLSLARSRSDLNTERITLLEDAERLMMSYGMWSKDGPRWFRHTTMTDSALTSS